MNLSLAELVIRKLVSVGVGEICLCAGARNSPLVYILEQAQGLKIYNFFDERSAAFFALGRIKLHNKPVAVITTSGTAVAELLPAAVEATYSALPLVLVTADRPRKFRGTGAPQSINQIGIFSTYVEKVVDIEDASEQFDLSDWSHLRPLQINVCFDEPLIDGAVPQLDFSQEKVFLKRTNFFTSTEKRTIKNPIVLVGEVKADEKQQILNFLTRFKAPVFAEGISNLRGENALRPYLLRGGEKTIEKAFASNWAGSVVRLGGVPTLRFWRDLEEKYKTIPVYSCTNDDWTGLSRRVNHQLGIGNLEFYQNQQDDELVKKIYECDQDFSDQLEILIGKHSRSEVHLFWQLAKNLQGQNIYLGNSLPIREWDLAANTEFSYNFINANRGANGIDGQISTFLGWAGCEKENWCIVGDLTALYDLSALWIAPKLNCGPLRIVIINNHGGQIFNKMFKKPSMLNSHELSFKPVAEMWGWFYLQSTVFDDKLLMEVRKQHNVIIELTPSLKDSDDFWMGYQLLK